MQIRVNDGSVNSITDVCHLTEMVKKLPDPIFAINKKGEVIAWNQAAEKMTGICAKDILGKGNYEHSKILYGVRRPILVDLILHSDEDVEKTYQYLRREGKCLVAEVSIIKDSKKRCIWAKATSLCDENGSVIGAIESIRDISDQKQAEKLLKIQRDLGIALGSTSSLEEAVGLILDACLLLDEIDCGGVYLINECDGSLDLVIHRGFDQSFVERSIHYAPDSAKARLVMAGKPFYSVDSDTEFKTVRPDELSALAIVPVKHKGQVVATLNLGSHFHKEISTNICNSLETIASHLGGIIARIRAEANIENDQKNLLTLFNTQDDFLLVIGSGGYIHLANPVTKRRLGYTTEEISKMTVFDLHPADQRDEVAEIIRDVLAGMSTSCPIPLISKDGTKIPVETRMAKGRWSDQEVIFCASRDITERKLAEEKLRQSEERLIMATKAARLLIWDRNLLTGEVAVCNNSLIGLPGNKSKNSRYHVNDWNDLVNPEDSGFVEQAIWDHIEGTTPTFESEYQMMQDDGRYIWVRSQGQVTHRSETGKPLRMMGISQDVSELKTAEDELRRRDILLASIATTACELLTASDYDLCIKQALETLGYSAGVASVFVLESYEDPDTNEHLMSPLVEWTRKIGSIVRNKPKYKNIPYDLISPDVYRTLASGNLVKKTIEELSTSKRGWSGEVRNFRSIMMVPVIIDDRLWGSIGFGDLDSEKEWTQSEEATLLVAAQSIGSAIARREYEKQIKMARRNLERQVEMRTAELAESNRELHFEIVEGRMAEKKLRDLYSKLEMAYKKLKEYDKRKSEFISIESHELRTPLTVINSYLEMFEDGLLGDLNENQREKLQIIRIQMDHMIRLVEDMLDASWLDSGEFKIEKSRIRLDEVARSVAEEIFRQVDPEEYALNLKFEEGLPPIWADELKIRQVFNNLLANAIMYSPHGGLIDIEIGKDGTCLNASVSDSGIGITKEDQERVFDKFFIGGEAFFSRDAGRKGLGLLIAKGIVEAHGGVIWVVSELGCGSTFQFTLPKESSV